jgi:hypothetical protein
MTSKEIAEQIFHMCVRTGNRHDFDQARCAEIIQNALEERSLMARYERDRNQGTGQENDHED